MSKTSSGRLANDVLPVYYGIDLKVLPEEKTFSGSVLIHLRVKSPVRAITVHALDLDVTHAEAGAIPGTVSHHPESETLSISFQDPIPAGETSLSLSFSGTLNKQMRGLYETKAQNEIYAFTQFQATDARRMFPCFDEPAFKARFCLSVIVPSRLQALSNMPVKEEHVEGAFRRVVFDETPVMSTYLLALAVARFEKKTMLIEGTKVSVWTMPGQLALGDFALEVTAGVLPLLNEYFDLPCPTPKLDLVSVPDFAMGAMENWGAIFFRDSCLLLDTPFSSTQTQRNVASVITHEIVHQWFGNLVTMAWWDDLWLNESFATWLACKMVDQWRPEWHFWWTFQQEKEIPLELDALENSRAIHSTVSNAAEIEEMFDALTYEKGGACLRMIEQYLGEDIFRAAVRVYIKRHQYKNATASDLWAIIDDISGEPISDIARDWFTQPGFPLVTLSAENNRLGDLKISQKRFFSGNEKEMPTWTVPMLIKYCDDSGIHTERFLFKEQQATYKVLGKGEIQWVYGNGGESGFYRTQYTQNLLTILPAVASKAFDPIEKIGVLDNFWALCQRGDLPISQFVEALQQFKGNETRVLVANMSAYLECLFRYLVQPSDQGRFSVFVDTLMGTLWQKTGWDADPKDNDERRQMRADLLWLLGSVAQDEEILSELPRRQMLYLRKPNSIDPTLVAPLLRLCARSDGGKRFDQFLEKFENSKTPEKRDQYLLALTDFNKPALARRLIDYALTDKVRSQDVWKPIRALLANPLVQETAWEAVKANWTQLNEKCGSIGAQRIVQATRFLWFPEKHDDIKRFFEQDAHRSALGARTIAQTLEFIRLGVHFKKRQTEGLSDWLRKNVEKEIQKVF